MRLFIPRYATNSACGSIAADLILLKQVVIQLPNGKCVSSHNHLSWYALLHEGTVEKAYIVGFQRLSKVLLSQCVDTSCSNHIITPTCCESKQHMQKRLHADGGAFFSKIYRALQPQRFMLQWELLWFLFRAYLLSLCLHSILRVTTSFRSRSRWPVLSWHKFACELYCPLLS